MNIGKIIMEIRQREPGSRVDINVKIPPSTMFLRTGVFLTWLLSFAAFGYTFGTGHWLPSYVGMGLGLIGLGVMLFTNHDRIAVFPDGQVGPKQPDSSEDDSDGW